MQALVAALLFELGLTRCQPTTDAISNIPRAEAAETAPAPPAASTKAPAPARAVACRDKPVSYDACTQSGETCNSGQGCCVCEPGPACDPELAWSCLAPPKSQDPTCPPAPPQPQSGCPKPDVSCSYCTASKPSLWRCIAGPAKPPFWAQDELRICR